MPYIGTSPSNGVRRVFDYTATAGQTSFSGSDNNSQTLAYTDSAYIDVYQNGILLIPSDYTATTGTTVVLDTGATVSDTVQIVAYDVFSVADTVSASDGGSFGGNLGVGGTLSVTGVPTFTGRSVHSGGVTVANDGQIGSVGDADAMAISSAGVVTFSQNTVGAGGMDLLLSTTISSAAAQQEYSSTYINSTYDTYKIDYALVPATDDVYLYAYFAVAGTIATSNYHFQVTSYDGDYVTDDSDPQMKLNRYGFGSASGEGVAGIIYLLNLNSTSSPASLIHNNFGVKSNGGVSGNVGGAGFNESQLAAVNGFRLKFSSGNIASGYVNLYGIRK